MQKILIIQNCAKLGDKDYNFNKVNELLKPFEGKVFDLIILPEFFSVGWYPEIFPKMAEKYETSETIGFLKSIAKNFNSNVIGGSYVLQNADAQNTTILRNACPFINREGKVIGQYFKNHLFSHFLYDEGKDITAGEKGLLINSDIGKIGLSICYDIRFPELYRNYAYAKADLLVNVAAWPKYRRSHWETLSKARAIENQCFMISVSQCGQIKDEEYNLGHSMVVEPYGEKIFEADENECALVCEIDLCKTKELRDNFPILKDRKELPYRLSEV